MNMIQQQELIFGAKVIVKNEKTIKIFVWDAEGQEWFISITIAYIRKSNGVFFVFDITKEESLQNVLKQYNEVNDKFASNCQIVLVGNKVDLESDGKISTLEVKAFADQQKMQYIEVSEKTDYNLNQLFESTATEILDKVDKKQIDLEKDVIKIGNYQEQNNISTENN